MLSGSRSCTPSAGRFVACNLSPDGRYHYFISQRPVDGVPREDFEPWRVEVRGDGLGEPEQLGERRGVEWVRTVCRRSGRIYFSLLVRPRGGTTARPCSSSRAPTARGESLRFGRSLFFVPGRWRVDTAALSRPRARAADLGRRPPAALFDQPRRSRHHLRRPLAAALAAADPAGQRKRSVNKGVPGATA